MRSSVDRRERERRRRQEGDVSAFTATAISSRLDHEAAKATRFLCLFIFARSLALSSFIPGFPLYSAPARFTLPPSRFFELLLLPLLRENEERLIGRRIIRFRTDSAVSRCPKRRGGRFPPLCPSLASQSDRAFTRHAVDCRYSSSGRETQNHRPFSPLRNVDADELPCDTFAFEARYSASGRTRRC